MKINHYEINDFIKDEHNEIYVHFERIFLKGQLTVKHFNQ